MISVQGLLQDPLFPRLKSLVVERTGMVFYQDKDQDLARLVADYMERNGRDNLATVLSRLADHGEMEALTEDLTIGETYFFRHRDQLQAIGQTILPEIVARKGENRTLRVWSAGCSTGPEPYSLSILFRRDWAHLLPGWSIRIIATDINRRFLAQARDGLYDDWAFRGVSDDVRSACFLPEGKKWRIKPDYQDGVSFHLHNLAADPLPLPSLGLEGLDLIICRNVVIYFSAQVLDRLIGSMRDSLSDGGWLIMGHAEPAMHNFRHFRPVSQDGIVLFQRVDGAPSPMARPAKPRPGPTVISRLPRPNLVSPLASRPGPAPAPAPAPVKLAAKPTHGDLDKAHALADGGQWAAALKVCDTFIAVHVLDPLGHLLKGLILVELADDAGAETALRRAIYLNRQLPLVHYHLGGLLKRKGDEGGAARCFRNALELLATEPEDAEILGANGMKTADLKAMIVLHLDAEVRG